MNQTDNKQDMYDITALIYNWYKNGSTFANRKKRIFHFKLNQIIQLWQKKLLITSYTMTGYS